MKDEQFIRLECLKVAGRMVGESRICELTKMLENFVHEAGAPSATQSFSFTLDAAAEQTIASLNPQDLQSPPAAGVRRP